MTRVGYESRSRIAIEWYDNENEAQARADRLPVTYGSRAIAEANIGYVHCGREPMFDRTVDGQHQYAVVTP